MRVDSNSALTPYSSDPYPTPIDNWQQHSTCFGHRSCAVACVHEQLLWLSLSFGSLHLSLNKGWIDAFTSRVRMYLVWAVRLKYCDQDEQLSKSIWVGKVCILRVKFQTARNSSLSFLKTLFLSEVGASGVLWGPPMTPARNCKSCRPSRWPQRCWALTNSVAPKQETACFLVKAVLLPLLPFFLWTFRRFFRPGPNYPCSDWTYPWLTCFAPKSLLCALDLRVQPGPSDVLARSLLQSVSRFVKPCGSLQGVDTLGTMGPFIFEWCLASNIYFHLLSHVYVHVGKTYSTLL